MKKRKNSPDFILPHSPKENENKKKGRGIRRRKLNAIFFIFQRGLMKSVFQNYSQTIFSEDGRCLYTETLSFDNRNKKNKKRSFIFVKPFHYKEEEAFLFYQGLSYPYYINENKIGNGKRRAFYEKDTWAELR